ncbi:MAG: TonB-dependent receptor [Gammaproteobacteria bacterium]|nr:TonB-dependent receptor [Gammaproteobacteria bacterium]
MNSRYNTHVRLAVAATLALPMITLAGEAADGAVLDEVVVTAQKRSQNIQDVPIAVTAVDSEAVLNAGIVNIQDLGQIVPTLTVSNAVGIGFSYLRGIGTTAIGPGIEYPVSMYMDGVYLASTTATLLDFGNIDRVEVLKGPQGTLFGRNATGGLIGIFTRDPTQEFRSSGDVSFDNYQTAKAKLYVGGGVTENLAADISVNAGTQGEGWGKNLVTGNDVFRNRHNITARSKWVYTPGDATKLTLIGDFTDFKHSSNGQRLYPGTLPAPGYGAAPQPAHGAWDIISDVDPVFTNTSGGVSLKLEQEVGSLNMMSLTAYRDSESTLFWDVDFTEVPWLIGDLVDAESQFSQELQLSSASDGPFNWTAGVYYFRAIGEYKPTAIEGNLVRAIFGPTAQRLEPFNKQVSDAIAGFAQGTFTLSPSTNLTTGIRYSSEKRTLSGSTFLYDSAVSGPISLGTTPKKSLKFKKPTYRVALDHQFNDDVMGYVSWNTGFKSGGWNTQQAADPSFKPEFVKSYEAGFKSDLLGRRLRFNGAAFYYDYSNIQVQKVGTANTGIINGAAATIKGIEAELQLAATDNLLLSGGMAWLHSRFDTFTNAPFRQTNPVRVEPGDASGNVIPFSPEFQVMANADYTRPLVSGAELHFLASLQYNDGMYYEADNQLRQKGYAKVNLGVRWDAADGRYNVKLWANNLTNEEVVSYSSTIGDGTRNVTYQPPRTYGITVGYDFK